MISTKEFVLAHALEALALEVRLLTGDKPYAGAAYDLLGTAGINLSIVQDNLHVVHAIMAERGKRIKPA
jgi:hypothetical protein